MNQEGLFVTQGDRIVVRCPHCNEKFVARSIDGAAEAAEPVEENESIPRGEESEEAFRESIVEQILARDFDLPMLPHVALRVVRLTANPDTTAAEIAKTIMTDQTVAAKILDVCNSPVYAGATRINSVSQAVVRLGLSEIKNLMLAISMRTKVFRSAMFGEVAQNLWEHSIACAFAARTIARAVGSAREEAFLGGLMHDLGKMVLIGVLETGIARVREEDPDFSPTPKLVDGILSQYHTDVGELVCTKWTLPEPIPQVVAHHHRVAGSDSMPDTVAIVYLADRFCHKTGKGVPASEIDLAHDPVAARLGIAADHVEGLVATFVEAFDAASGKLL